MKKANLISMFMLGIGITVAHGQRAVPSSGGDASGSVGSASYSNGQMACSYQTGSTGSINQGVQQRYEFFPAGMDENNDINLTMSVFPNPTNATISLLTNNQQLDHLIYRLYDMSGKQILSRDIRNSLTLIPMETFTPGSYLLKVCNTKNILKTFTLIKNQ